MKKLKPLPRRVPKFSSYRVEAAFWDSHDTAPLIRKRNQAKIEFVRPVKHLISIRLDLPILEGLRAMAARKHVPYQTLIQSILAEKLHEWHKRSA